MDLFNEVNRGRVFVEINSRDNIIIKRKAVPDHLCGWNQREAARELQVHYNTVRYRYERICELTGDLSTPEKQVEVSVALHLCRLNPDLCHPETPNSPSRSSLARRGPLSQRV